MKSFLMQALAQVVPKQSVLQSLTPTLEIIQDQLRKQGIKATAEIGGSVGKDTYLKEDFDCDIFVLFDRVLYSGAPISVLLEKALRSLKPQRVHGSRDYFQLQRDGVNFEIIPVLHIDHPSQAENITDCSPLHVRWVKKFNKGDEIRLTKAFCKAAKAYGAESYIGGFSGHVIDILTIYYGSFENLIRGSQSWKKGDIIDINSVYKGDISSLNESKKSPLIVIDPIDPSRNAAAALSEKRMHLFIEHAKNFLAHPSLIFFEKKEFELKHLALPKTAVVVELTALEGKRDVIGAKLLKSTQYIAAQLEGLHFSLKEWDWHWKPGQTAICWFIFSSPAIPEQIVINGPPVRSIHHARAFKQRHPSAFIKDQRLYAHEEPEYTDAKEAIIYLFKDSYLKNKILGAKIIY